MTISNLPPPDELADVRAKIKTLEHREAELKQVLLSDPGARTGVAYLAEIKTVATTRTDLKEMRACYPAIVEQFVFPAEVTRVELRGISEDGEITNLRRKTTA